MVSTFNKNTAAILKIIRLKPILIKHVDFCLSLAVPDSKGEFKIDSIPLRTSFCDETINLDQLIVRTACSWPTSAAGVKCRILVLLVMVTTKNAIPPSNIALAATILSLLCFFTLHPPVIQSVTLSFSKSPKFPTPLIRGI